MRCEAPIPHRWITGQRGVGVARMAQWVGGQVHALPWSEHGELQDRVEVVRYGGSVSCGDIILYCVDDCGGSGVVSAN